MPPTAKIATKNVPMDTRMKSSERLQRGALMRSRPDRTPRPTTVRSTVRAARKKASTRPMPVQNHTLVSVAMIGCGAASTM